MYSSLVTRIRVSRSACQTLRRCRNRHHVSSNSGSAPCRSRSTIAPGPARANTDALDGDCAGLRPLPSCHASDPQAVARHQARTFRLPPSHSQALTFPHRLQRGPCRASSAWRCAAGRQSGTQGVSGLVPPRCNEPCPQSRNGYLRRGGAARHGVAERLGRLSRYCIPVNGSQGRLKPSRTLVLDGYCTERICTEPGSASGVTTFDSRQSPVRTRCAPRPAPGRPLRSSNRRGRAVAGTGPDISVRLPLPGGRACTS